MNTTPTTFIHKVARQAGKHLRMFISEMRKQLPKYRKYNQGIWDSLAKGPN